MKIKCRIEKIIFKCDSYQIVSAIPTEYNDKIKITKYGNFRIKDDTNLLTLDKEYTTVLKEQNDKYGTTYILTDLPNMSITDVNELTDAKELELLEEITTKDQAQNIHKAYPDFIRLILSGNEDKIDYHNIYNVAEIRLNYYINEVNSKFKHFYLMSNNKEYKLSMDDCKTICSVYFTLEKAQKMLDEHPYQVLIDVCKKSFDNVDKLIISKNKEFKTSDERIEYAVISILQKNEYDNSTCMDANVMAHFLKDIDKGLLENLKNVVVNSEKIFYDDTTKKMAIMDTYLKEVKISNFIKYRLDNTEKLDWDWQKFTTIKDGTLTDEQSNLLKQFCEHSFVILDAPSGCVDRHTEYFNGRGWKKIQDYTEGEKVLQYSDTGYAELVEPLEYHKLPCDMFYRYNNSFTNQILSAEHNVLYVDYDDRECFETHFENAHIKEIKAEDLYHTLNDTKFKGKVIKRFKNRGGVGCELSDDSFKLYCHRLHSMPIDPSMFEANARQIKQAFIYITEHYQKMPFITKYGINADFYQFILSSCGFVVDIEKRPYDYVCEIEKNKSPDINFMRKMKRVKSQDGYKYCFTVPSNKLILRRGGKIFVTGNCGKTSTLKALLDMCDYYHYTYTCLAFTGKASSRLAEQTNRTATTIHRATINKEITTDVLIVDEYSMLSVDLMDMIIEALANPDIRVVFVGDTNQIPSIGKGRIAKDLLESNIVPNCTLTHCFRFDEGGASYVSTLTRKGEFYLSDDDLLKERVVLGKNKDYTFIKSNGTVEQIVDVYMELINKGVKKEDICILTPYNKYEFGATNINNLIQAEINPPKKNECVMKTKQNVTNICLRKDDLVMNIKNNYNAINLENYNLMKDYDVTPNEVGKSTVYNGQTGKVLSVDDEKLTALIDDEIIVYDKYTAYNLLLSYATNPFKFQGSSCKYIINLILPQHKKLLNRQLLYTAQTRQEVKLIEIGDVQTIKETINTLGDDDRETMLKDLLKN